MFRFLLLLLLLALAGSAYADAPADLQAALADPAVAASLTEDEFAELQNFYAQRGYRAAWNLSDDEAVKKTLAFVDSVEALVTYHGLIRSGYRIDEMRKLAASKEESDRQKLEFMISESLLRLAHDLHGDATDLPALYTGWDFKRTPVDVPALVGTALNDGKLEALFDKLAPQNDAYRVLARALQDYREFEKRGAWQKIDAGPSLKPGERSPRVTQLRARLAGEGYEATPVPGEGSDFFDEDLSKVLIVYQTRNGLSPDGHLGGKTIEALNTPIDDRIAQIRANMERWRNMPEDFPPARYTEVNIPDFSVTIVEDSAVIYRGIVIDGKPDRQTPFIDSKIVNMLINPPWNVPLSIARKDILPKLRKDPHYLEKLGIEIGGRTNDPTGAEIDWKHMSDAEFHYSLRQSPGDLNSLGLLKFNFKNPFDVYMHGTPHQELFGKAERDFSSGCVRLEDPVRVGEILLAANKDKGGWSQQRINDQIDAGKTQWVTLANPMPVYFLYWTVFAADEGQVNFRKDIYGYDSSLMDELKSSAEEK